MKRRSHEYRIIYGMILCLFLCFLAYPLISLLMKSFSVEGHFSLQQYTVIIQSNDFMKALQNSMVVSISAACCAVGLAFILAYTINYTNVNRYVKKTIALIAGMPMLLPTITYGFAIIYSFGKQGLLTQLVGFQFFDVYGFSGILLGYVIYTLPIAFLLLNNAMKQIDKKFITVSRLMNDHALRRFYVTVCYPLLGSFAASLIQCFFLSFTDFGIPASVGGQYHVLATVLYSYMLGSIPDFAKGAVIAMIMLIPSILSIAMMQFLQKYQVRYAQVSIPVLKKNKCRDVIFSFLSLMIGGSIIAVFAVIFILPFISQWPYQITFTLDHIKAVFADSQLLQVIQTTLVMSLFTAFVGTLFAYGGALVSERGSSPAWMKKSIAGLALVTNTIPGMVIGISYLFIYSGTPLQNTLLLLVLCNVIHFFSTPYLMMKETLSKMNDSYEITAKLMGDSWVKTVVRIITPNAWQSLMEVFTYYFINASVTVSAIIFIAGARTMVITTKIKELQYFAKFNEVFVLSLLLFAINLIVKYICAKATKKGKLG